MIPKFSNPGGTTAPIFAASATERSSTNTTLVSAEAVGIPTDVPMSAILLLEIEKYDKYMV